MRRNYWIDFIIHAQRRSCALLIDLTEIGACLSDCDRPTTAVAFSSVQDKPSEIVHE